MFIMDSSGKIGGREGGLVRAGVSPLILSHHSLIALQKNSFNSLIYEMKGVPGGNIGGKSPFPGGLPGPGGCWTAMISSDVTV